MAINRYNDARIFFNNKKLYEEFFDKKDLRGIRQYATPRLAFPTDEDRASFTELFHLWKVGDRYYKLAYEHYGDSRYWWVIAQYNKKPTESNVNIGDIIVIPFPLESVFLSMGM